MTRTGSHWPAVPTARHSARDVALRRAAVGTAAVLVLGGVALAVRRDPGLQTGPGGAPAVAVAGTPGGSGTASGPASGATSTGRTAATATGGSSGAAPGGSGEVAAAAPAGRRPVTLAFAGDVHFEGSARAALGGDLGSAGRLLRSADVAVVNLETAITERGVAQPKQFTFRAPARALSMLRRAGVDAVSVANNHGMDFGREGLTDTLAASRSTKMPVLGAGRDVDAAFRPWRTTVRGLRLSVVAATDVLDSQTWEAAPGRPGLASAKDPSRLLAAVRREASRSDVVVVFLHWGVERVVCPTARQRDLARQLSRAGADVVVGSHAHVVQPTATVGRTLVHYGMGNFVWYASGGAGARTGVLTVSVDATGVRSSRWRPASISGGRPQLLSGTAARQRAAADASTARSCG